MKTLIAMAVISSTAVPLLASSYYPVRLDDAKAVYLTSDHFPVTGDGIADDSNALQQAINKVQETTNQGILFVPAGRYRLTKTIYIWPGIRLIGFGQSGPHSCSPLTRLVFSGARPTWCSLRAIDRTQTLLRGMPARALFTPQ